MKWDKINVPGLNPDAHYFKLPAGETKPRRLSFTSKAGLTVYLQIAFGFRCAHQALMQCIQIFYQVITDIRPLT